jgi:DNA uptake protein ComE-like DNA-binding protein
MSVARGSGKASTRWAYLSLVPLGLGAWAPIYAGTRARNTRWILLGVLWTLLTIVGWVLSVSTHGNSGGAGLVLIVGWIGAIATSFAIRPAYERQFRSELQQAMSGAEDRIDERRRAARLAREKPTLAREIGIGRPDLPHARAAGLVDVNNAPANVLAGLPGVDDALATQIVETRAEVRGFSSVEDLGATLDLDPDLVDSLRDQVVFLPRH